MPGSVDATRPKPHISPFSISTTSTTARIIGLDITWRPRVNMAAVLRMNC